MKDDALTVCPKDLCAKKTWGKGKVKRQMGAGAGLIFKGSGFYITDYRSEGYKQAAKADTGGSTSSVSSSTGTSKPAETKKAASTAKPAKTKKT